ncbi:MAG: phage tail tape measure protein [Actinomycetota bacterium]
MNPAAGGMKNIFVMLRSNATQFEAEMFGAGKSVQAFGRMADHSQKQASGFGSGWGMGGKLAAAGVTLAVVALGAFVGKGIEFEKNMRNVNSIAHLSEAQLGNLGKEVLKLSGRLPQSANELAKGLYEIASSGFQGEKGVRILAASAEAASAGLSTTAVAAKGITATINAYGLSASDAGRVSDALFQTVNLGVISFEELASGLGDYVGMAATAGIPIEQVGAAIATITLSGIPAAEAGTALNRVMQSLLEPSEALSAVSKKLGRNLVDDLKNPAIGLNGVMEMLRKETGGNVVAIMQLFPELRAAKGALALMADEGKNANRVFGEMDTAEKNLGATKRALAEQAKGLGYQINILKNQGEAWAIGIGTAIIPHITKFLDGVRHGAGVVGDFTKDIAQAFKNVIEIAKNLGEDLAPFASALMHIIGIPIALAIKGIGVALRETTEFFSEHRGLVLALAGIYVSTLIPSIAGASLALLSMAGAGALAGWTKLTGLVSNFGDTLRGISVAQLTGGTALAGIGLLIAAWTSAKQKANDYADEVNKGIGKVDSLAKHREAISAWKAEAEEARKTVRKYADEMSFLDFVFRGGAKGTLDNVAAVKEAEAQHKSAGVASKNYAANIAEISRETGVTTAVVEAFAKKAGADLDGALKNSKPARDEIIESIKALAEQAGLTEAQVVQLTNAKNMDPSKVDAAFKAMEKAGKAAGEAFTKTSDIFSEFGKDVEVTGAKIEAFYKKQVEQGTRFAENLQKGLERGLDPAVVQRALVAGPQAAAGLIDAIVKDSSGKTIEIVNKGERATQDVTGKLTTLANQTSGVQQGLGILGGTTATPKINADDSDFQAKHSVAGIKLGGWARSFGTARLNADDSDTTNKLASSHSRLGGWARSFGTAGIRGDDSDSNAKLNNGHARLNAWGNSSGSARLNGDDSDAQHKINRTRSGLQGLVGRAWDIAVNIRQAIFGAEGLFLPPGMAFAGGTEDHRAQIAPGMTRVWAEPETGGEAYIPLAAGKRTQSTAILGLVASQFGYGLVPNGSTHYANGGRPPGWVMAPGAGRVSSRDAGQVALAAEVAQLSNAIKTMSGGPAIGQVVQHITSQRPGDIAKPMASELGWLLTTTGRKRR